MPGMLAMVCVPIACPPLPVRASLDLTGQRRPVCSARYAPLPGRSGCAGPPGKQAGRAAVPPLVQRAPRPPRNAETSCTVHRRSVVTTRSLLLCVTMITDLRKLQPDSLSQPSRFLASPHRHLWRSRPPASRTDLTCPKQRATSAAVTGGPWIASEDTSARAAGSPRRRRLPI